MIYKLNKNIYNLKKYKKSIYTHNSPKKRKIKDLDPTEINLFFLYKHLWKLSYIATKSIILQKTYLYMSSLLYIKNFYYCIIEFIYLCKNNTLYEKM